MKGLIAVIKGMFACFSLGTLINSREKCKCKSLLLAIFHGFSKEGGRGWGVNTIISQCFQISMSVD